MFLVGMSFAMIPNFLEFALKRDGVQMSPVGLPVPYKKNDEFLDDEYSDKDKQYFVALQDILQRYGF